MQKKKVVLKEILRGYFLHIFKKCLLSEAVLGLFYFIFTFFVLFIGNNLLELIQGNHAN
jgi:hypothetical protein